MKRYYHINRIETLPSRGVAAITANDSAVELTLAPGFDFSPLELLYSAMRLEVSDEVDDSGRRYAVSLSAIVADGFNISALKRESIVMRLTDTDGIQYLIGSPEYRGVVTSAYSNQVAAGTLGRTLAFSSYQDYDVLPLVYKEYVPVERFSVSPEAVALAAGQGASAIYAIEPDNASKKK